MTISLFSATNQENDLGIQVLMETINDFRTFERFFHFLRKQEVKKNKFLLEKQKNDHLIHLHDPSFLEDFFPTQTDLICKKLNELLQLFYIFSPIDEKKVSVKFSPILERVNFLAFFFGEAHYNEFKQQQLEIQWQDFFADYSHAIALMNETQKIVLENTKNENIESIFFKKNAEQKKENNPKKQEAPAQEYTIQDLVNRFGEHRKDRRSI